MSGSITQGWPQAQSYSPYSSYQDAALMPSGQKLIPSRPPQQSQHDQTFPVPTPPGAWAPLSSSAAPQQPHPLVALLSHPAVVAMLRQYLAGTQA